MCLLAIRSCYVKCDANEERYIIPNNTFHCANVLMNGFPGGFFYALAIYQSFRVISLPAYAESWREFSIVGYSVNLKDLACINVIDFNFPCFVFLDDDSCQKAKRYSVNKL